MTEVRVIVCFNKIQEKTCLIKQSGFSQTIKERILPQLEQNSRERHQSTWFEFTAMQRSLRFLRTQGKKWIRCSRYIRNLSFHFTIKTTNYLSILSHRIRKCPAIPRVSRKYSRSQRTMRESLEKYIHPHIIKYHFYEGDD